MLTAVHAVAARVMEMEESRAAARAEVKPEAVAEAEGQRPP